MSSAIDELRSQVSGPAVPTQMVTGQEGIDLQNFLLDVAKSKSLDINVAGSITDGTVERSIDTASTVSATIHDPRRILLNSDIWDYTIDVQLDGNWFRHVQASKSGDDLSLTFEDRIAGWMRSHRERVKFSRNKVTRAEFIKHLVDMIHADNKAGVPLDFVCPQLHKKQPILKAKKEHHRRKQREPGVHKDVNWKIDGKAATKEQKAWAERILDVGHHLKAPRRALVASIMCALQESTLDPSRTNGSHVGLFQQDSSPGSVWVKLGGATRHVEPDATAFFKTVMPLVDAPYSMAGLVEAVQHSGQGSLYAKWETAANDIVHEYGDGKGDPGAGDTSYERTYAKSFQYMVGPPDGDHHENFWQAAQRLAQDVQWRFFVVGNTVYYVSDWDLLKSKPIMVIDEESDGILAIDYDHDVGKRSSEATVTCRAEKWFAHPGEVVTLKDSMGPGKGRWLVERISRPFFSNLTTITLYTPHHSKKEPAPELNTVTKERKSRQSGGGKAGSGKVTVASDANRPNVPIKQIVMDFLDEVSQHTGEDIEIICGTNHNQYSTSGLQSDHWTGNAADIGVGGDARQDKSASSKGDNIATAALMVLGIPRATGHEWAVTGALDFGVASTHQWRGHRVQVGWKTLVGGNHFNHVHIGVK